MLDSHNNPVGVPQTHYITPKQEPGLLTPFSPHQMSPPPYPGSDQQSDVGTVVGSDFGVDPLDEDDGKYLYSYIINAVLATFFNEFK